MAQMPQQYRGGYRGLDEILAAMMGERGMGGAQFLRMSEGRRPGGQRGRFTGLSSQGLKLLSRLLTPDQSAMQDTTGLDPNSIEYFKASLLNEVLDAKPQRYKLREGIDQGYLNELFGSGGAGLFSDKRYAIGGKWQEGRLGPPRPDPAPRRNRRRPKGGYNVGPTGGYHQPPSRSLY